MGVFISFALACPSKSQVRGLLLGEGMVNIRKPELVHVGTAPRSPEAWVHPRGASGQ